MRITSVRRAGLALAAALAVTFSGLVAAPAQALAPDLDPDNRLGDLTLDVTGGAISWAGGPQRLTTETGCPEGFRRSSRAFIIWPDGTWVVSASQFAATVFVAASEGSGLDGQAIDRQNLSETITYQRHASKWGAGGSGGIPTVAFDGHSGVATYVVTCDPGDAPTGTFPTNASGVGDSKYFSVDILIDWNDGGVTGSGTWEIAGPVEKVDTTLELDPTAGNDGSVNLTATVDPPAATGSVTFTNVGTGATVGTADLTDGTATVNVSDLEPDTQYTFRAEYAGDTLHNASTSNDAVVTTVGEPVPPQDTEITVTIPAAASGLRLTVTPGGVALGEATQVSSAFEATGELGQVTVTDDRETRTAWTLNGQASDFARSGGSGAIPASALGWEPQLTGGTNAGTAGPAVAPGTGLAAPRTLASATADVTTARTTVAADLTLRAPQDTPAGEYTSTLTLTLI
ncbi:Ig-like domain-containing protein [Myceligenerans pegani]|uniref:Ig-like domain repeat protein n=1 Tax=Myceligenerans pegani TaxID=2776917 RepID=A0ABR9N1W9_9MICO|nr:Ig-like domain-containing protein [Myceligenerans sp. TRM 65318]MBE1877650.1 Ig-like domain repeat protein [Myceligenerans sp. TRM 65318]MBE3019921.1 Ig-like domain repeat protein [Myceligenerans sp. TRM 65318]